MTSLVAVLSSGKGTWGQVSNLITKGDWTRVYLICSDYSYDNFDVDRNKVIKLKIDENRPEKSINALSSFFRKEVKDFEVALNMVSGTGMEHMALMSAILKAGLGIRMVYWDELQVKEMEILDEKFVPLDYLEDEF